MDNAPPPSSEPVPPSQPGTDADAHARAVLKAQIERVIERHTHFKTAKPPFTARDLTVMAALCSDGTELTAERILRWILGAFAYYRENALDSLPDYAQDCGFDFNYGQTACAVEGFFAALDDYDSPVKRDGRNDAHPPSMREVTYTVQISQDRLLLSHILEPKRKGTFPFLELPAELRITIYEMLLLFPRSKLGFWWDRRPDQRRSKVRLMVEEKDDTATGYSQDSCSRLDSPPKRLERFTLGSFELLRLLSTCKQIYSEAMPVFYRDNDFQFENLYTFQHTLSQFSRVGIEHLSSLRVLRGDREAPVVRSLPAAMASLKNLKMLKRLELYLGTDDDWLKMQAMIRREMNVTRSKPFVKIAQIPGFSDLAVVAAKTEEFIIHGECPKIRAYIDEEVKKIKGLPAPTQSSKQKRKTSGTAPNTRTVVIDDEESAEPPKMRTKRSKAAAF